jgi:polysaccharide pyruvyl transferase WcaK-like protein
MIYHVFANRSNIGDWLSAKGIQKLLAPADITECLCDVPYIGETMAVLSKATERDLIVIGGGGLLMDYFVPFWEAFLEVAQRVPFCIWGVGYCDLKLEASLPAGGLIEDIVSQSRLCYVRDELSRSHLPHCRLPEPVPCPSINLIEPAGHSGSDLLHVVNYSTVGAESYDRMCLAAQQFVGDRGIHYRETNNRVKKNGVEEMNRVLAHYASSDIILSSALHGCIIGVAMGKKVVAVSGDRKIEAFMAAVGLEDWVLDIAEVPSLRRRLDEIGSQQDPGIFLKDVRRKNEVIASQIRRLAAGSAG